MKRILSVAAFVLSVAFVIGTSFGFSIFPESSLLNIIPILISATYIAVITIPISLIALIVLCASLLRKEPHSKEILKSYAELIGMIFDLKHIRLRVL